MKKMKNWMAFVGTKNLIAIGALLVLVVAISVGIAISNSKTDEKANDEVEESSGLQVEENADDVEGDSIDFSEFQTEEEKYVFPFEEIGGFAFSLQMKILFSMKDGTYYEVDSEIPRSAVKYMVLYRFLIGKEYY